MKIIFLIPPSEGKNSENNYKKEELSFLFEKPLEILKNATEKDLKCKWKRFEEATNLNLSIDKQDTLEAIKRYSGVMYNAISYEKMSSKWKKFFEQNFLIFSWLYWILEPKDKIVNYKLPIEAKWLYNFWWDKILKALKNRKTDYIVNLLPISYAKLIFIWTKKDSSKILKNTRIININFLKEDGKKVSHWVKKIKWEWIKELCEKESMDYKKFSWKINEKWNIIDVNINV